MIARVWTGWATVENAQRYEAYFREHVVPVLRELPGYGGARLFARREGEEIQLLTHVYFESMAAVRRFAGDEPDKAVVAPEAQRLLLRFDERVQHFEQVTVDSV